MPYDYRRCFPFPNIRVEQQQAIDFALDAFLVQNKRCVILEVGTGGGKSAIGVTIARYLAEHGGKTFEPPPGLEEDGDDVSETTGAYVLTTQKILQQQYVNDFGPTSGRNLLCSLKSATNYNCRFYEDQTCAESRRLLKQLGKQLEGTEFHKCCRGSCPYLVDKQEFIDSPIGITNFSYFLAETMYAKQLKPRALLVIDECVRGDARVWVDDDLEVNMREVFDNHAITHVMSFNETTNQYERRRITRRIRTPYTVDTQWVDIHVDAFGVQSKIRVTGNHKIWTKNRGMVRADELTLDDVVKLDVLPKRDVTRKFVAHRAGKTTATRGKNAGLVLCDTCAKMFTVAGLKQHRATIIEVRECLGEGCSGRIEVTKSTGGLKRHCSHKCYSSSPVTRTARSQHMLAYNPMYIPGVAAKAATTWRYNWHNVRSEESKQEQLTRFKNAPLHENRVGPNRLEQQIIDMRLPGVRFTGLGGTWVTFRDGRHKNPDFIIDGTRKVIEVGDVHYWHTLQDVEDVKRCYTEIGYECLYVTNDDLVARHDETVAYIRKFVCNHDIHITKLVKLQKPRNFDDEAEHFKYNIEVDGNHNYFVNSVLVSNCHNIENELGKFVEVTFSERFARQLGCKVPKLDTPESVFAWIKGPYKKTVTKCMAELEKKLSVHFNANGSMGLAELSKRFEMLDKHLCKVNRFIDTYNTDNWIMNPVKSPTNEARGGRKFEFKPVDVSSFGHDHLYRFGSRVVMMSATVVDKDTFCKSVGLDPMQAAYLKIPSPFPLKNRPIHFLGVGSMSMKHIDETLPKLVVTVKDLLELHANDKGIIHCVSFKVAKYLVDNVKSTRMLLHNSENREETISLHLKSPNPTVLVSPSMTEGVDLADDASRFQILCKVPFPYLGDQVIQLRKVRNPGWYACQTARSVIQALGRSIRNDTDHATSYILDADWQRFYQTNVGMFPEEFSLALV
jgi:hypothetical protein